MITPKEKVRDALDRAQDLGASSIEEACAAAAQALGVPVDVVREVAYELAHQATDPAAA